MAADITSGSLPFKIQKAGADVGTRHALNPIEGANIGLTVADDAANDRVTVTVALASVPAHTHAEADVTNLATDLAGKAPLAHTHAEADITGLTTDLAGKAALSHTHSSSQITDATAAATPGAVVLRDGDGGASFAYAAANNLWAYQDSHLRSVEWGPFGKAVELKREMVAGQERVLWNPVLSIPAKDFEFTDPEVARIKAALQTWDGYGAAADRRWLEPLLLSLFA